MSNVFDELRRMRDDLNRRVGELERRPLVRASVWHEVGAAGEPSFLNGWSSLGGSAALKFRRVGDVVTIAGGCLKSDNTPQPIFALPVEYRPASTVRVPIAFFDGSNFLTTAMLNVNNVATGTVTLGGTSLTLTSAVYPSVTFLVG